MYCKICDKYGKDLNGHFIFKIVAEHYLQIKRKNFLIFYFN